MNLADQRWPEIASRADRTVLAIPFGATEQHGTHLPLDTDTAIATELCRRLASHVQHVTVAPAVPYGSSGEHSAFPGTLSIGQEALGLLVLELIRSADAFAGAVLVNGHGGNLQPLQTATATLQSEGRHVLLWSPRGPADDSHAGRTETSAMLQLRPESVAMRLATPGNTQPLPDLIDTMRRDGVAAISPNGVLGDPTGADAAAGEAILAGWTESLVTATTQWFASMSTEA